MWGGDFRSSSVVGGSVIVTSVWFEVFQGVLLVLLGLLMLLRLLVCGGEVLALSFGGCVGAVLVCSGGGGVFVFGAFLGAFALFSSCECCFNEGLLGGRRRIFLCHKDFLFLW